MPAPGRDNLVIIPTYNEAGNLEELVPIVLQQGPFDIFVIDDNSPDGTGELADELAVRFGDRISVVHRPYKRGLGAALVTGFRYALAKGYRHVFQMDADLSHDATSLAGMRRALDEADVVIGSRYVDGGRTVGWPGWRQALSQMGSLYSRFILRLPVRDPTGGYKGFRKEALETVMRQGILSKGFAVQIEINYRCVRSGLRVVEVPTVFSDRARGRSKMSLGIAFEALVLVARLRIRAALPRPVRSVLM